MSATFIFLMFVLKIPIAALIWIVWWAIHAEPEVENERQDGGSHDRPHPRPPLPRRPRRGPHGDPAVAPPPRTRTTFARSRTVEH